MVYMINILATTEAHAVLRKQFYSQKNQANIEKLRTRFYVSVS